MVDNQNLCNNKKYGVNRKSMISVEMQPFSVSTFLVGVVMAKVPDDIPKRSH
ncbi:MAG: hypothetical protein GDA56_17065 [Hormoscilla sp. GM7CHS1pb]|nr:hypothetical protein [Hormoscilla sp. GM7CHS1pb]